MTTQQTGRFAGDSPGRFNYSFPQNGAPSNTSSAFTLPAGVGQMLWNPLDHNAPGLLRLLDANSNAVVSMTEASSGYYASRAYFQTTGGTFTISSTVPGAVVIAFAEAP